MKKYNLIILLMILSSCNKDKFLDVKPQASLVVPTTLEDYQALLDNDAVMNGALITIGLTSALGDAGSDDYYLADADFLVRSPMTKNVYLWNKSIYTGGSDEGSSWGAGYKAIFYANLVLEGLEKIERSQNNQVQWDNLKGSALFYRSFVNWHLAQVYAPLYDVQTAKTDLGIPLRKKADINEPIFRSTNDETYSSILEDLNKSLDLLPITSSIKTRPSKLAAYSMLARTYLSMRKYAEALESCNLSLNISQQLMDYGLNKETGIFKFKMFNDEVIFQSLQVFAKPESASLGFSIAKIDSSLIASYSANDMRKTLFFRLRNGVYNFSGSYTGGAYMMTGLAIDELYITRAECYARNGQGDLALSDLNFLLKKRFKTNTYVDIKLTDPLAILKLILIERRKELLMRGLRWTDLRRLNREPEHAKTLSRKIGGIEYTLPPNDPRYTYPIPLEVVQVNPGMPQNER